MINRELIRIKVVQLVYAYYMNDGKLLDVAERELLTSLSKAYEMYNHLLNLIVAVTNEERMRCDLLIQRAKRENTEMPVVKFAFNRFAVQLEENEALAKYNEAPRLSWNDDIEFVRKVCNMIEQTDTYKEYMLSPEDNYEADREVWRKLYKQILENNDELDSLLEEKSIYWNDDKQVVDSFIVKTIKRFAPENKSKQELMPEFKDSSDRDFAIQLFRACILNKDEYQEYLAEASRNWELHRMPFTDIVIMQAAVAEMLTFPAIPLSVTINEYVDLSKVYSTPKSAHFINGMLDGIARSLIADGKLLKQL